MRGKGNFPTRVKLLVFGYLRDSFVVSRDSFLTKRFTDLRHRSSRLFSLVAFSNLCAGGQCGSQLFAELLLRKVVSESKEMASSPPVLFRDESQTDKLSRKMKDAPFVPIGLAGLVGACAVGAYKYRHRGQMSTSVFLMQLRVAAQSMVVGCMTLGLAYQMYKEYLSPDRKKPSE